MNKLQTMETLSKILNNIYNAMDEVGDIADNDLPKSKAESYLILAAMEVDDLMDKLNDDAHLDGTKSGAI